MYRDDPYALAKEFRQLGWNGIASFIVLWEESPTYIDASLFMSDDDDDPPIIITDPFAFFSRCMRERERYGSIVDLELLAFDEYLTMLVAIQTAPSKRHLH